MEDLTAAQQQAQNATQNVTNWSAQGMTLADELRQAVGERFGQSGVAKEAATNRANFMATAPQARSDILGLIQGGSILSPTQQNAILASKRAAAIAPVMGSNILQEAAFGSMQDLINAGVNAWNAQSTRAQGAAQLAQQNVQNILQRLTTEAQLKAANEPKTSFWEDASGNTWLVNSITGEKIQNLGRTYHAPTGGGTAADKQQAIFEQLKSDARSGATFGQIMNKYVGKLDASDILMGYNTASKYGPVQASAEEINKKYGTDLKAQQYTETDIANYANAVASGSLKINQVPISVRGDVANTVQQINDAAKANKKWYEFWK